MTNTALSSGIGAYWPLLLVGICGIVLVIIALLALLLLKESRDFSVTWKLLHTVRDRKGQGSRKPKTEHPVDVCFYRIGRDSDVLKVSLVPQWWYVVGSDGKNDICLDAKDTNLTGKHFKMRIRKERLWVEALEGETFTNGVPIRKLGAVSIGSGDLIRAGSHEYRVIFPFGDEKENAT